MKENERDQLPQAYAIEAKIMELLAHSVFGYNGSSINYINDAPWGRRMAIENRIIMTSSAET